MQNEKQPELHIAAQDDGAIQPPAAAPGGALRAALAPEPARHRVDIVRDQRRLLVDALHHVVENNLLH